MHGFPPDLAGGTERHVAALAKSLRDRGHDVIVVTGTLDAAATCRLDETSIDGLRVVRVQRDDLHFERWDRLYHPTISRLLTELLRAERPDVVHVHHWLRLSADLVRTAANLGIPAIVTLHDHAAICPTMHRVLPGMEPCTASIQVAPCAACVDGERFAEVEAVDGALMLRRDGFDNELRLASRVFGLSNFHVAQLRAAFGPSGPTIEAHPFCSSETLRPGPRPADEPPVRVLTLGRVAHEKGQDLVMRAMHRSGCADRIELDVFGECHDPAYARELSRLGEGLRWRARGRYSFRDLEAEPFHVAVLPSRLPESYGLVLDEAQMLGLPAFVSTGTAYRERIGEGGRAFPTGDVDALAHLLSRAVEHPEELAAMRDSIPTPRRFGDYVSHIEEVYRAAVDGPRPDHADGFDLAARLEYEHRRGDRWERRAE